MGLWTADVDGIDAAPKGLGGKLVAMLRGSRGGAPRLLSHVETLHLGPKRSVYLLECEGERFLVSAGGESLSAPVPLPRQFVARTAATEQER